MRPKIGRSETRRDANLEPEVVRVVQPRFEDDLHEAPHAFQLDGLRDHRRVNEARDLARRIAGCPQDILKPHHPNPVAGGKRKDLLAKLPEIVEQAVADRMRRHPAGLRGLHHSLLDEQVAGHQAIPAWLNSGAPSMTASTRSMAPAQSARSSLRKRKPREAPPAGPEIARSRARSAPRHRRAR